MSCDLSAFLLALSAVVSCLGRAGLGLAWARAVTRLGFCLSASKDPSTFSRVLHQHVTEDQSVSSAWLWPSSGGRLELVWEGRPWARGVTTHPSSLSVQISITHPIRSDELAPNQVSG